MKFSTIASILSAVATVAAADTPAASAKTCIPYDGVCFQNGVDYGACCGDGICAGSLCRNPKTAAAQSLPASTATSQPPKTETGVKPTSAPNTKAPTGGAKVTQIGDGQIQAPTGAPTMPVVVAGAGKAIPGLAAAGAAVAFLL